MRRHRTEHLRRAAAAEAWGALRGPSQLLLPSSAAPAPACLKELGGMLMSHRHLRGQTTFYPSLVPRNCSEPTKSPKASELLPRQGPHQSRSCPFCQRRAWTRLSGRQCPRNTRSACSSSVWPEWHQWQTRSPGSSPAERRTRGRSERLFLRPNCPLAWWGRLLCSPPQISRNKEAFHTLTALVP